ncbi:MAG: iron chaperone [Candidatus Limnocylindrales bacterium]
MDPTDQVDTILAALPAEQRAALQALRELIARLAPEAEETISYGMPGFRYRGRFLVSYAGFKGHCSLFPMSGDVVARHPELATFAAGKGTYHFSAEQPIPDNLVEVVVRERMAEIDARPARGRR